MLKCLWAQLLWFKLFYFFKWSSQFQTTCKSPAGDAALLSNKGLLIHVKWRWNFRDCAPWKQNAKLPSLCLWPSKPLEWFCNRSVWAKSIKTVEVKLHKCRLKIDHILFLVSVLLSLLFLWLTTQFCLQLFCVCHKSAPDLDLCTGCSKALWVHRSVKYAPYFFPCSVKEVARHGRVVTSLLWRCFTDVASHA